MKLDELFSHWETIRAEMIEGVSILTQQQLDWKPSGWSSSIADLLRHISEAELWWMGNVVLQNDNYHDLTASMAPDLKSILKELEISHSYTLEVVNSETIESLDKDFEIPGADKTFSLKWILWHTIEHEMRHRGQIFMLIRLQGMSPPDV